MSEIKIRPLTRKDRKYITGLIQRLSDRLGPQGIRDLISADFTEAAKDAVDENISPRLIGVTVNILTKLIEQFEIEMETFFISILSMPGEKPFTVEKLDDLPLDAELDIIIKIVESEEGKGFFTKALRLRSLMSGLSDIIPKKKTA